MGVGKKLLLFVLGAFLILVLLIILAAFYAYNDLSSSSSSSSSSPAGYTQYNGMYGGGLVDQCSGSQALTANELMGATSSSCALSTLADAQTMCNSIPSCTGIITSPYYSSMSNPYILVSGTTATPTTNYTSYVKNI
jgi:hypothetical protein